MEKRVSVVNAALTDQRLSRRRQSLENFHYILIVRRFAKFIELSEDDLARLVDHVDSPFVDSRNRIAFAEDAVFPRYLAVGIEVAQQGVVQLADFFFLPRDVAPGGVNANAHDLGIVGGELVEFSTVRRHLLGSRGCPIQRIEGEHNVLLAAEVAQAHFMTPVARDRWKFEIRSRTAN